MVLKLTDNINKIQHVFGLSYNKLLILFSIIFAHGGYDIFVKFNSGLSIYQTKNASKELTFSGDQPITFNISFNGPLNDFSNCFS